jgi:hypothetical protein
MPAQATIKSDVRSTSQPCHVDGGPQPQPRRLAGNQYLRSLLMRGGPRLCDLTLRMSAASAHALACQFIV